MESNMISTPKTFYKIFGIGFAKRVKKAISEKESEMANFSIVKKDDKISSIVNQLRDIEKYKMLANEYDTLEKEIDLHNERVYFLEEQYSKIIKDNPTKSIVDNIEKYNIQQLQEYVKTAIQVLEYHFPADFPQKDKFFSYAIELGNIVRDYQRISKQHELIQKINSYELHFADKYIDSEEEQKIYAPIKQIVNEISALGTKYYQIPQYDFLSVKKHNEEFVKKHIDDQIFDNVNGFSLDKDQRRAILCDSKSNLVVAGAGSGKTLTICGKVKYLLSNKMCRADEILLMSYSNNSAKDLENKVSSISTACKVKTFHALGLEILTKCEGKKQTVDEQFASRVKKFFEETMFNNPVLARAVFDFCSQYMYSNRDNDKKFEDDGKRFEDLAQANYTTLKDRLGSLDAACTNQTIQKEFVKSYQELIIANFLYINGIKYTYEKAYEYKTATLEKRQYTPDFYLDDYGIYIEHYGITKDGRAPQYSRQDELEYIEGMEWKRKTHKENGTCCLETYSYEFSDGTIFKSLENKLKENGVKFNPIDGEGINSALRSIVAGYDFSSFEKLVLTFISLYKAMYTNANAFGELANKDCGSIYDKVRAVKFLHICKMFYESYVDDLRAQGKIDFDDMILQACDKVGDMQDYKYKYIIVDEFQDISWSRYRFLKALIKHGNAKLFAVGDDWQSIYRFAGCDVGIFLKFRELFDDASINMITTTHRNSADLLAIVEPFITANPQQIVKHLKSNKRQTDPVTIVYTKDKTRSFVKILQKIRKTAPSASVLVLGRNRNDIDCLDRKYVRVDNLGKMTVSQLSDMNIIYKTVHQSKGLESDYVILVGAENALNGFPNRMEDDVVLQLLLSDEDGFDFAEERRLFYVALTRTRNEVYVLVDPKKPSVFVEEIEENVHKDKTYIGENNNNKKETSCPWCKSGHLVWYDTNNTKGGFFGCSNYPYCKYTIDNKTAVYKDNRCPVCGDFLVIRRGENGTFLGCHGYPYCTYTQR